MSDFQFNDDDANEFFEEVERQKEVTLVFDLVSHENAAEFAGLFREFKGALFIALKNYRISNASDHKDPRIEFNEETGQLCITLRDQQGGHVFFDRNAALRDICAVVQPVMQKIFGNMKKFPEPAAVQIARSAPEKTSSATATQVKKLLTFLSFPSKPTPKVPPDTQAIVEYQQRCTILRDYFAQIHDFFASTEGQDFLTRSQENLDEEREIQELDKKRLCEKVTIDFSIADPMDATVCLNGREFYFDISNKDVYLCWFDSEQPGRQRLPSYGLATFKMLPGIQFDFSKLPILEIAPIESEATITMPRSVKGVKVQWKPVSEGDAQ